MKQKLLTQAIINKIPPLYAQDGKGDDAVVHVKFFLGGWTWFVTEASARVGDQDIALKDVTDWDQVEDVTFFGLVDGHEEELGPFSFNELKSIRGQFGLGIERDAWFDNGKTTIGQCRRAARSA